MMCVEQWLAGWVASTSGDVPQGVMVMAYIGPGAGLGAIGPLLAMVGTGIFMLIGFVWYPIRKVRRWCRARRANANNPDG